MDCPNCGALIEKPGRFCAECGAPLAATAVPADWSKLPPPPPPDLALSAPPPPPAPATGSKRGRLALTVAGLVIVAVTAGAAVAAWPQISRQLGLAAASSTPGPTASPSPTESPSPAPTEPDSVAPTASPAATPTGTPAPTPTFLSSGFTTPELAIGQFISDQGYAYGGDCATPSSGADYCSSLVSTLSDGRVYAIGGVASEAQVWALLRQIDGQWYVAEVASAAAGSPAPWH